MFIIKSLKERVFIKKEVLTQVFSCKFCEIFKNTFFKEHLRATASGYANYLVEDIIASNIKLFADDTSLL